MANVSDFLALQELTADELNAHLGLFARKTADETVNNSAVLQNDGHLFLSVAANTTYELSGVLHYFSGTTPDLKIMFTVPSGTTMKYVVQAAAGGVFLGYGQDQSSTPAIDGHGVDVAATLQGLVFTSSTAGTVRLQWAQNTANASNTVMRANSYILLRKLD